MVFPTHIVAAGALVTNEKDEVLDNERSHMGWEFPNDKLKMEKI